MFPDAMSTVGFFSYKQWLSTSNIKWTWGSASADVDNVSLAAGLHFQCLEQKVRIGNFYYYNVM